MKIIIPPFHPHPGQQTILGSKARYRVMSCGRRFGKTALATEWLALAEGGAIDGSKVGFFAPSYKLLLEVWSSMERTLKPVTRKANKTEMRIELITGGVIDFWTLEDADAGRGRKYHRIVVDEAAHARYLKDAWERAIAPTLTDYRGEAWFISTPKGLNFFHDLFQRGNSDEWPEWQSFQLPTAVNPFIPSAEVESMRSQLPNLVYCQEYEAQFVTFGGGLVKSSMLRDEATPANLPTVLGVDLAISTKQGADFTAIAALSRDPATGVVYVREVERHRCEFNQVLERIKAAAARHRPTVIAIEQTQYQAAVIQELTRTTSLPVRGVRPDKDKITRFAPLLTRYEQRMVCHHPTQVPAWFRDELLSFPEGEHDDGVDAVSYAYSMLDFATPGQPTSRPSWL